MQDYDKITESTEAPDVPEPEAEPITTDKVITTEEPEPVATAEPSTEPIIDEDDYTEIHYSKLPKLAKYEFAYQLWKEVEPQAFITKPMITRVVSILTCLVFLTN